MIIGLSIVLVFVFTSCSKDDDENKIDIAGTKWETTFYQDSKSDKTTYTYTTKAELEESGKYEIIEFHSEGTFTSSLGHDGTWTFMYDKITIRYKVDNYSKLDNLIISGDVMTLNHIDSTKEVNIRYKKM